MDNALGIVHDVARTLQFSHHIRANGELTQVDGPVLQSGVLHWAKAAVHRLKTETGVGDRFGEVGAVHLD